MQGSSDPNRQLMDATALVGHLVRPGTVYALLAEHRHRLFPDEMFADLFASARGRPSVPADVIATVMVLQSLEGFSDRDAIEALRTDLRWKVAAGLRLDDEGFHPTVLTLWRNKLRASDRPKRIFGAVAAVIGESGVIAGKTRRVLDSTVLDDAVVRQDAIMQLVAQIRKVRRLIGEARRVPLRAHDYEGGGAKPVCAWDDPVDIERVVTELINDAIEILLVCETLELSEEQADAVGLLALVAQQDVEPGDALGYIFGYTVANDVSDRDLQKKDGQFIRAKGFDTYCPVGPWVETDIDISDLPVRSRVNGETRQDQKTSSMLWNPAFLISYISGVMTLKPGDLMKFYVELLAEGASIDPVTGQFRWTPSEAQGPGLYDVTVVATDDAVIVA